MDSIIITASGARRAHSDFDTLERFVLPIGPAAARRLAAWCAGVSSGATTPRTGRRRVVSYCLTQCTQCIQRHDLWLVNQHGLYWLASDDFPPRHWLELFGVRVHGLAQPFLSDSGDSQ